MISIFFPISFDFIPFVQDLFAKHIQIIIKHLFIIRNGPNEQAT